MHIVRMPMHAPWHPPTPLGCTLCVQDLPEALSPHDVAEAFDFGRVGTDGRPSKVVPVCAYTGQGLRESTEWLVETIKRSPRTTRLRMKHIK